MEEQGGFRPGRGCADQLFVLTSILKSRKRKRTYCCFIDVRKAYDRVWRDGLWKALWLEGIRGKMWRIIRSLYKKIRSCIILGKEKTESFDIEVGVRQGCVISPILFSIFINRLAKEIVQSGIGVMVKDRKISILLYADDIVLIAETKEDLQIGMDIVARFGKKWRCKYSIKKTQVEIRGV